jgi:NAD(P)-dependent dehydrogenase (short-subunit alcohol dehydrogenase family)
MRVAILDVSVDELEAAKAKLEAVAPADQLLAQECNVVKPEDCVAAAKAVEGFCGGDKIAFLFNNAGIQGPSGAGGIIADPSPDTIAAWQTIFNVNVFGQVNILKAFAPAMIAAGPLASGKKAFIVTTSSVVGLLNHVVGPYSISKMAATAVCEQFSLELQQMGSAAEHVSAHSLHPTVAATNFLTARGDDGTQTSGDTLKNGIAAVGGFTAEDIISGLFSGLEENRCVPVTSSQFVLRPMCCCCRHPAA